jgi:putative sterol carrier protein
VINSNTISTADGPADCTIRMSLSDLEDMIAGDLSPTTAYMTGKIKIEGDMAVAMQLQQLM